MVSIYSLDLSFYLYLFSIYFDTITLDIKLMCFPYT